MGRAGEFLPQPRQRADVATMACVYVTVLTIIPSALILRGVPLSITPATVIALFMGLCWMCAHATLLSGMAKGRNPVRTVTCLFAVSLLATFSYGNFAYLAADEMNQADRTLILVLSLVGMAMLICDGIRTRERIDSVLRAVAVCVAIVGFIGGLQFAFDIDLTAHLALPGLKLNAAAGGAIGDRSGFRRVAATTGSPIEFGVLCAMVLPLALHYGLRARMHGRRRWPWYACSALIASGLLFSISRSAVLGIMSAGFVLIVSWPMRRRLIALATTAGFLVVAKFAFPGLLSTFVGLFQNLGTDDSIAYRTQRYPIAAAEIAKNLWLGRGVGTWYYPTHFALDNQYIMTLIESGVLGFAVLVALYVTAVVTSLRTAVYSRTWRDRDLAVTLMACASVPVVGSVTFDLLSFHTLEGILFVTLGIIGALFRIVGSEREPHGPASEHLAVPVAAGAPAR